jgi:hypothetical protein
VHAGSAFVLAQIHYLLLLVVNQCQPGIGVNPYPIGIGLSFNRQTRKMVMNAEKERASVICVKDTPDGAYPSLVLGINSARQGMESKICLFT